MLVTKFLARLSKIKRDDLQLKNRQKCKQIGLYIYIFSKTDYAFKLWYFWTEEFLKISSLHYLLDYR